MALRNAHRLEHSMSCMLNIWKPPGRLLCMPFRVQRAWSGSFDIGNRGCQPKACARKSLADRLCRTLHSDRRRSSLPQAESSWVTHRPCASNEGPMLMLCAQCNLVLARAQPQSVLCRSIRDFAACRAAMQMLICNAYSLLDKRA